MTIVDLFARIGLKTDEEKAKSFDRTIKGVKQGLIAATAAAAGVSLVIKKVTSDALDSAVALKQFSVETGASTTELQRWQSVLEQTNQPIENVNDAIKQLAANREKIKLGQGDISGYQLLGIDPNQDPFKILEDLRDRTGDLSQAMKKNMLSQLGLSSGLLQSLEMSKEQFDDMAARAFIIDPKAIETLTKTKANIDTTVRAINYMKTQIAVGLSPQITKLTKRITEFISVNEEGIIKGFKVAFEWVMKFTGAITNSITSLDRIITNTIGWENAVKGLIGVIALLNVHLLASPIGMITAGIILLIALMDDLYIYSQGGKSMFGQMVPELETFKELFDAVKGFDQVKIDAILDEWGTWGDILEGVLKTIQAIVDLIDGGNFEVMTNAADKAREAGETGKADMLDFFGAAIGSDRFYDAAPGIIKADWWKQVLSGGGFGNISAEQARTQNNNINMNVYGSSDPEQTGNTAARMLRNQIEGTSAQLSRDE